MSKADVMKKANWSSLAFMYKISLPKLMYNMRNSVARRGAIAWNTLVPQLNDDVDNLKKYAIMARRSKVLLLLDFYLSLLKYYQKGRRF